MNKIKIEDSDDLTIKHILNLFKNLEGFKPKENNLSINDFLTKNSLTIEDKQEGVNLIYGITKNIISHHLEDIVKKINNHPKDVRDLKQLFSEESSFLNELHSPATKMKYENIIEFNGLQVVLDKGQFIDEKMFSNVEKELTHLFQKQLESFKSNLLMDLLIFQIDNKKPDAVFVQELGNDFMENKNFIRNEKNISSKYVDNLYQTMYKLDLSDENMLRISDKIDNFYRKNYHKDNRSEILEEIQKQKTDLLASPGMLKKYDQLGYDIEGLSQFGWQTFFRYGNEAQLIEVLETLSKTENFQKDIKNLTEDDFDPYSILKGTNSILGQAFSLIEKFPQENKVNNIFVFERFIDSEYEKIQEKESNKILTPKKDKMKL